MKVPERECLKQNSTPGETVMTDMGIAEYRGDHKPERAALTGLVRVRPSRVSDIDPILGIDALADRPDAGSSALSAAILDESRLAVVASVNDEIIGWRKTHYWSYADGPAPAGHYLGGVTVSPKSRRQGMARALTQARLDWIWDRVEAAWYLVNPDNLASIELHRQWGFTEVARAAKFHTTNFTGGTGLLLRAKRQNRA